MKFSIQRITADSINYHLGKLVGQFVHKTDDGYALRRTGRVLAQSIIAGAGIEDPTLDPTEVDASCPSCGAPTEVSYENHYVYLACTSCRGERDPDDDVPPGTLVGWTLEPTRLSNRTLEEVFATSTVKNFGRIGLRFEGICPTCSGLIEWSLDVCEDHESTVDTGCPTCGRKQPVLAQETCTVCKSSGRGPPGMKVLLHPAVIAFY